MTMAFDLSRFSSSRPSDQLQALRLLKNDVVGHVQRKERWVRAGALRSLVEILETTAGQGRRNAHGGKYGKAPETATSVATASCTATSSGLSVENAVSLEALQLLASFASAGPAFLPPLHAADALSVVLRCAAPEKQHARIVLASLRLLRSIADSVGQASSFSPVNSTSLADIIFSEIDHLESFSLILRQSSTDRLADEQVTIVATLISALCREERHQLALVNCGALDALATILAGFAVAEGQVIPHADVISQAEGLADFRPSPARPGISLSAVLGAIAAVVTNSPFRACRLLYSPSILAVFPNFDCKWSEQPRLPPEGMELPTLNPTKQKVPGPMDLLLPYMPPLRRHSAHTCPAAPRGHASSKDVTKPSASKDDVCRNTRTDPFGQEVGNADGGESPLVPWLITVVRSRDGITAVMAASLLTCLFKGGFCYKTREKALGLLVVPKLLEILSNAEEDARYAASTLGRPHTAVLWEIVEHAPATLARLVTDSELLQKAALECKKAIKTICRLLKSTYDTALPPAQSQLWSPEAGEEMGSPNPALHCRVGEPGVHPVQVHRLRVRESTLRALGALATFKDEYRKAIMDQDMVPYIVLSLSLSPVKPGQSKEGSEADSSPKGALDVGSNPVSVIVAACHAVCMLSRSVSILRTALVDHAVAMPIFRLLRHPSLELQIAATGTVCNMVTDFSPMRQDLVDAGIMKVLCDYTRSPNASLRLNALWGLKHLVHGSSNDFKKACLEELGTSWLLQLITDDQEDEAVYQAGTENAKQDDTDHDMDMDMDGHSTDAIYSSPSMQLRTDSRLLRLADTRLAALREMELNPMRKARQNDLLIQEQGLGFLRNLIGGANSSSAAESTNDTTAMIDHLFDSMGQDNLFKILARKLKVRHTHPLNSRRGSESDRRVLYPQPKILEAVVYILVHLAASIPRHRESVIGQKELLESLAGLLNSQDREVRVAMCHLINNLTWQDDTSDATACQHRVDELMKLEFFAKLEVICTSDDDLDVRERAKSALWQMRQGY